LDSAIEEQEVLQDDLEKIEIEEKQDIVQPVAVQTPYQTPDVSFLGILVAIMAPTVFLILGYLLIRYFKL
jgi:hypothetical protein